MRKKICIFTGSRAEYSSFHPLLEAIKEDGSFILQIIVSGMHMSNKFGLTYREIEKDGFAISKKVKVLLFGDTESGITKSVGLVIFRLADILNELKPDLMILVGDRFETFAAAVAGFIARIPIAHIGGGDITKGVIDEAFRHSITKMAYLHFAITPDSRKRIIQLGEDPRRVFTVGAPAIDNIKNIKLLTKKQLEKELNFTFGHRNILVTFHPVTLEDNTSERQFRGLLEALDNFRDLKIIFTKPNADLNGNIIVRLIDNYVKQNPQKAISFISLGQLKYLSLLQYIDVVIGNSSSGIVEVPLFGKPTVNIGDRQNGRVKAKSVIDCRATKGSIIRGFKKALSKEFMDFCKSVANPYGGGDAAKKIVKIIKREINKIESIKKDFYKLPDECFTKISGFKL